MKEMSAFGILFHWRRAVCRINRITKIIITAVAKASWNQYLVFYVPCIQMLHASAVFELLNRISLNLIIIPVLFCFFG